MNPNVIDQNQQTVKPIGAQPQPPVAPEQFAAPVPQPVQPTAYTPAPVPEQKKSKAGLIIALAVGLPLLIVISLIIFFVLGVQQTLQSKAAATAFLTYMTAGDVDAAVKATGDESSRSFLTTSSAKLKGSTYTSSSSEYNAKSDSYYLFALRGSSYKSARVIIAKEDGKRIVKSFVYDTQTLALKPGSTSIENTQQSSHDTTSTTGCFAPSDYSAALGWNNTITFNETNPYLTNVHFLPDSLEYDGGYQDGYIGTIAKIVTTNPSKDYKIRLYGSTATTAASDKSFANQRADKVKQSLIAKGVAGDKIIVDAPQNIDNMGGSTDEVSKRTARVVVIKFTPACTTDATSSTTGR